MGQIDTLRRMDSRAPYWLISGLLLLTSGCSTDMESPGVPGADGGSEEDSPNESEDGVEDESEDESESESETGDDPAAHCYQAPGIWDVGHTLPEPSAIPGNPVAGEWALLHQDYVSCGVPYDLFMLGKGFLGTYADGKPLPWREGKSANLPYNWNLVVTEAGTELATMNCLTCHAGEFNGDLVIGLGRHDADFTQDLGSLLALLPPLPEWTDAGVQINKFRQRYQALGPHIRTYTVGSNPADDVAVILASHRNPYTLAWSDQQLFPIDPPLVPVDTPPWWRVKKKAGHFYNGMSRGDHRGTMMFASSLCIDSAAQASAMLDYFADIRAYLESLEPPKYPRAIDPVLAEQGQALFECNCAGCHGTYDPDPAKETFPNLLIPLEVIGTDPLLGDLASGEVKTMVDWYNKSWYGTITQLVVDQPFVGYTAPPLDGIWATAPFFHNGSVPTLELVLDSSKRPKYWRRQNYDSTNIDWDALGWVWEPLAYGQSGAPVGEAKHVYDTTILGHGNGGHTFGDHLSDDERKAVLEYLKTL
jgi:mono/diheme cytochrome c family protein